MYQARSRVLVASIRHFTGWTHLAHEPGPGSAGAEAVVDSRSRSSTHTLHPIWRGVQYSDNATGERKLSKVPITIYPTTIFLWKNNAEEE